MLSYIKTIIRFLWHASMLITFQLAIQYEFNNFNFNFWPSHWNRDSSVCQIFKFMDFNCHAWTKRCLSCDLITIDNISCAHTFCAYIFGIVERNKTKYKMFYEISIAFLSVFASFVIYFLFMRYVQNDHQINETEDEVVFDQRHDLDGKELLLVSVVRMLIKFSICDLCTFLCCLWVKTLSILKYFFKIFMHRGTEEKYVFQ